LTLMLPLIASSLRAQTTLRWADRVRITTDSAQVVGYVTNVDTAFVRLDIRPGKRVDLARSQIKRLELHGTHAAQFAKNLGITGLVTGAAFGALLVSGMCEVSSCSDDYLPAMAMVGVTFGGVGALVGGVIGSFIPDWRPVDPARVQLRLAYRR
jgi:hypothetical protein